MVIHDFTLERTTDGAGPVSALRVRELKRLDAGGWRDRRFEGQRVQTLQEVFERFRDRTRFWLELKGGAALYPGLEERVVSTIEIYDVVDRVLVESFDPVALDDGPDPEPGGPGRDPDRSGPARPGSAAARRSGGDLPRGGHVLGAAGRRDPGVGEGVLRLDGQRASRDGPARRVGRDGIITDRPGALRARLGR